MKKSKQSNLTTHHSSVAQEARKRGVQMKPPAIQFKTGVIQKYPAEGHSVGVHPDDTKGGPYAHISAKKDRRIEAGAGLVHKEFNNGGQIDAYSTNLSFGKLGGSGAKRIGVKGNAQMIKMDSGNNGLFNNNLGGDMALFNANTEASVGENGATLGGGANIISGALRVGNLNKNNASDEQIRLGLGLGAGMEGRLHWGDEDKDGRKEYGIGADLGIFSADIKTEDPVLTILNLLSPQTSAAMTARRMMKHRKPINLTESLFKSKD